jgi:hypothetical protein
MEAPAAAVESESAVEDNLEQASDVVTTQEELEGYQIVKAIACSEVKPYRVAHRDQKSYFAILLDDNNRKPIARLWFNGKKQKYIGLFDENKVETKHPIDALEDIYDFAETVRNTVRTMAELDR